ncbi:MAG: leucine-rich repeat protein, partial [Candidatus Methanomethylophilaceae archaeon]
MTKNKSIMLMSLVCLCLMCVCAIGTLASDDSYADGNDTVTENGLTFQLTSDESGNTAMLIETSSLSGEITVPAVVNHNGVSYSVIGSDTFKDNTNVTKVVFLGDLSEIPGSMFYRCTKLESVGLNNVTSIGASAFYKCTGLTEVNITGTVRDIADLAFYGCTAIESIHLTGVVNIGASVFYNCTSLATLDIGYGVETIGSNAFYNTKITTFRSDVLTTVSSTFSTMKSLVEATLPSVTVIRGNAFYNCTALEKLTVSDNVSEIGSNSFYKCTSLTTLNMGITDSTTIGNGAFNYVILNEPLMSETKLVSAPKNVATFDIPSNIKEISYAAFRYANLETITIPSTVNVIGTYAFADCRSLVSVTISSGVTEIGSSAFNNCSGLTSVTIPSTVTDIGSSAFYNCTGLTSVTIEGNSLKTIGSTAFSGCTSLTDMEVPSSVESVGASAFLNTKLSKSVILNLSGVMTLLYLASGSDIPNDVVCIAGRSIPAGVESITIPASVRTISSYAFAASNLESITVPGTVELMDNYAFGSCLSLKSVVFESGVTYLPSYCFSGCTALMSVTLPNTVTTINERAFFNCQALTEVTIPASVNVIAGYAFYNCKALVSVDIQGTPEFTGTYVFYGCAALKDIVLKDGMTTIPQYMFYGCSSLESIKIPSTVTSVAKYSFYNTGLTSVTIPASVKFVEGYSFTNCTKLESVIFEGDLVLVNSYAFSACTAIDTVEIYGTIWAMDSTAFRNVVSVDNLIIHSAVPVRDSYFEATLANITTTEDGVKYATVTYVDGITPKEGKMILSSEGPLVLADDVVATTFTCLDAAVYNGTLTISSGNTVFSKIGDAVVSGKVLLHAGYGTSNLIVSDGIVTAAPFSLSKIGASLVMLPASMESVQYYAFESNSSVKNLMINSDVDIRDTTITNVKYFKNASLGEISSDIPLYGVFTFAGDNLVIVEMDDVHASISMVTDGTAVAFVVKPDAEYDRSVIKVSDGTDSLVPLAADSSVKIGDVSVAGMYYISSVTGDFNLYVEGIALNQYDVAYVTDSEGYIVCTFGGSEDVYHGSIVSFSVAAKPGYLIDDLVVKSNGELLTPTSTLHGTYCYTVEVTDDIEVSVSGIVMDTAYTVTVDTDGGTSVAPVTVYNGMTVAVPTTEKPGYIIEGWYTDSSKTVLYDFSAPVTANFTLYAKWIADDSAMVTVDFSGDNGTVSAVLNGYREIVSGTKVPSGSTVAFIFDADLRYEITSWIVNGETMGVTGTTFITSVKSDVVVKATSIYTASTPHVNLYDAYTPVDGHYVNVWNVGAGNTSGAQFTQMTYMPSILGGYAYAKVDNYLEKIDIETGEIVKIVKTADSYSGFYNYVCTGNGLILDCLTGKVFDQDLEQVFAIGSTSPRSFYYDQKFFVATANGTYCYSAVDADPETPDNLHDPLWIAKVNQMVSAYAGTTTMFFSNDFFYGVAVEGSVISLITVDVNTGALIDEVEIPEFEGKAVNTGYIDLNEGYATLTVYGAGLFDPTSTDAIINIASVKIDDDGYFNRASLRTVTSGTGNSYCSALIVHEGLGYVFASGTFQVYDMETMQLIASSRDYAFTSSSITSHGSMAITTGHDGKVIGYVIPYGSSKNLCVFEYTIATNEITSYIMKDVAITAQYASGQVRIAENGYVLWVNDSGTLFCAAYSNDVTLVYPDGSEVIVKVIDGKTLSLDPALLYYVDETRETAFDTSTAITENTKLYVAIKDWYVDGSTLHITDDSVMSGLGTADQPWRSETFSSAVIEDGVTLIGDNAFYGFIGLKSITVPESVKTIGANAFYGCIALETFSYTAGFDDVDSTAFTGCISLKYTVKFVSAGSVYAEVSGTPFTDVRAPADPVREGYTFEGWNTDIPPVMPMENVTITAVWSVNSYTVTFILDGEEYVNPILLDYGTVIQLPTEPSKATDRVYTYEFSGWSGYTDGMTVSGDVVFNGSIIASARPVDTYTFWLIDSTGEDESINGWYTADGTDALDAFMTAMDTAGIAIDITYSTSGHFFGNSSIEAWSVGAWASDGNLYNPNYAIWNWNETRGWFLGGVFGTDTDKVYIISHER